MMLPWRSWCSIRKLATSCRFKKKKTIIPRKPFRTEEELARRFIDHKRICVFGGKGGDGRSSFMREKTNAFGGPDGGNGGNGGNVIFVGDHNMKSLENIKVSYSGENGVDGGGANCFGRNGKPRIVKFPVGTYFRSDTGEIVQDLSKHEEQFVAAYGGLGGKGNKFFVTNTLTAPEECTPGEPGEEKIMIAELRTLAHGGLIGFPNAGKSTLLRVLTRATPLVAEYQFTTLRPHVGILHFEDFTQIGIADIPGIIAGASENKGLGLKFLRHIERCRFLIYVIDLSDPEPWLQLQTLRCELSSYDNELDDRPCIYIANKLDLPKARKNFADFSTRFKRELPDSRLVQLSGKNGTNLENLIHLIREFYDEDMRTNKALGMTVPMKW